MTEAFKQLPIAEDSKNALITARVNIFYDESDTLARRMYSGEISLGQWQESMKSMVREVHSSAAAIGGGGWDEMTAAQWGRLGTPMREQYRWLQGFTEFIEENRETISLRAIQARARLYGEGAGGSTVLMQAGPALEKLLPFLPKDGSTPCFFWADKVRVYTRERGYVRLSSVNVGEHALSHTGVFREVLQKTTRYVEDVESVVLNVSFNDKRVKVCVTPEHMFLSGDGYWVEAQDLVDGDVLQRIGMRCKRDGCDTMTNLRGDGEPRYCSKRCATIGENKWEAAHERTREMVASGEHHFITRWDNMTEEEYGKAVASVRAAQLKYSKYRVGKTYEELYGAERAAEIKAKVSADKVGKTYEELYAVSDVVIESVEHVTRSGTVKCLVVDGDESFVVTKGLISHNCLNRCHCRWELDVFGKQPDGGQEVSAVWLLGVAEHCDVCVERDGHTESFVVPRDVEVPSVIGGIV